MVNGHDGGGAPPPPPPGVNSRCRVRACLALPLILIYQIKSMYQCIKPTYKIQIKIKTKIKINISLALALALALVFAFAFVGQTNQILLIRHSTGIIGILSFQTDPSLPFSFPSKEIN